MAHLLYLAGVVEPLTPDEHTKITEASHTWERNYPPDFAVKSKETSGSSSGIDIIVGTMLTGQISKKEIFKISKSEKMLSIAVQINARLKKLGLKMKKTTRGGETYYGTK